MDASGGWVKFDRALLDSEVFQDAFVFRLYCWCLLTADRNDQVVSGRLFPPGSLVVGRITSPSELHCTPDKLYAGLDRLAELGHVKLVEVGPRTVVTVCNYSSFDGGA